MMTASSDITFVASIEFSLSICSSFFFFAFYILFQFHFTLVRNLSVIIRTTRRPVGSVFPHLKVKLISSCHLFHHPREIPDEKKNLSTCCDYRLIQNNVVVSFAAICCVLEHFSASIAHYLDRIYFFLPHFHLHVSFQLCSIFRMCEDTKTGSLERGVCPSLLHILK